MRIFITQMDIDEGQRGVVELCPIAQAIRRQLPGSEPRVGYIGVTISGDRYGLPEHAGAFALAFDADEAVMPFWFDIPLEVEQPVPTEAVPASRGRISGGLGNGGWDE